MSLHLLVYGRHPIYDSDIEDVHKIVRTTPSRRVRACADPSDLLPILDEETKRVGKRINRLDLFDHGHPGAIGMGGGHALFSATATGLTKGEEVAVALRTRLTPGARLRMLGCQVAASPEGLQLLLSLRELLGEQRAVYATLDSTKAKAHFDSQGFMVDYDCLFLFSSREAKRRGSTPSFFQRVRECAGGDVDVMIDRLVPFVGIRAPKLLPGEEDEYRQLLDAAADRGRGLVAAGINARRSGSRQRSPNDRRVACCAR